MRKHARSVVALLKGGLHDVRFGAEIGVWRGHTTAALLKEFPDLVIHAVDPWQSQIPNSTMPKNQDEMEAAYREFLEITDPWHERLRTHRKTSELASVEVPDGCLDFTFIDGVHLYPNVLQDMTLWWPKIKAGGLFCGHDYNGKGDRVHNWGVKRAVDEWLLYNRLELGGVAPGNVWWVRKT